MFANLKFYGGLTAPRVCEMVHAGVFEDSPVGESEGRNAYRAHRPCPAQPCRPPVLHSAFQGVRDPLEAVTVVEWGV